MINLAGSIDQESKLDQHMFLKQVSMDYSNYDYGRSINDRGVDIFCDSNYQKNIKPPMVYEQQTENRYHSEVNNNNYEINDGKYGNESEVNREKRYDVKEKKSKQPIRLQVLSNSNTAEQGNYPEQSRQSVIEDNQQHFRIRQSWLKKNVYNKDAILKGNWLVLKDNEKKQEIYYKNGIIFLQTYAKLVTNNQYMLIQTAISSSTNETYALGYDRNNNQVWWKMKENTYNNTYVMTEEMQYYMPNNSDRYVDIVHIDKYGNSDVVTLIGGSLLSEDINGHNITSFISEKDDRDKK